ncbi:hypothetical protein AB6735_03445 [Mucilaginibacter sp. RCC_168]|uniref:hypothetical protein n=1 Tax=Mucilaginibacter sp. RCC_168 TaxID=3239221 RepID=UPI0035253045
MAFTLTLTDHSPLFTEVELTIPDEDVLAENIGFLLLGHQRHVQSILASKGRSDPSSTDLMIDDAQAKLVYATPEERYKRDGWIFQLMTWIALRQQNVKSNFFCQIPHDAAAQHGIDGLGVRLTSQNRLEALVIAEDKYTENPRRTIKKFVWPDFEAFEKGTHDAQLVNRTTGLIDHLNDDEIDDLIENDIYQFKFRQYKAGITPEATHMSAAGKKRLFKKFDNCVKGSDHLRRIGVTFYQADIRSWMDDFCEKISDFLETQRP